MTSKTQKERHRKSYRCPECDSICHLKKGKYECPEHGIVKPMFHLSPKRRINPEKGKRRRYGE